MVGQRDVRLKSEFGFAMRMRDMDVHSRFLAGKEEQAEGAITDDSRGHSGLAANVQGQGRAALWTVRCNRLLASPMGSICPFHRSCITDTASRTCASCLS